MAASVGPSAGAGCVGRWCAVHAAPLLASAEITGSGPFEWDGDLQAYEVEADGARVAEILGRERQSDLVCRGAQPAIGLLVEGVGRPFCDPGQDLGGSGRADGVVGELGPEPIEQSAERGIRSGNDAGIVLAEGVAVGVGEVADYRIPERVVAAGARALALALGRGTTAFASGHRLSSHRPGWNSTPQ